MSAVSQTSVEPRFQSPPATKDVAGSNGAALKAAVLEEVYPSTGLERLALTRRGPQIMRRPFVRAAVRISVLLAGDTAALLLLRAVLHGVRDVGWLGPATSA